jgi:hypothetical protein
MSSYQYHTLGLPEGRIRLLRLLPHRNKNARIDCELFTCSLSDSGSARPYDALSYAWGPKDGPQPVHIDNCKLSVTANLHAALLHLRDASIDRILWVDAICINQDDDNEKGLQVQSMAKIFAQASRVIVWLGETAENSDEALETLRMAAEEQYTNASEYEEREKRNDQEAELITPGQQSEYSSGTGQQAIIKLLERSWFQRIWVRRGEHVIFQLDELT